MFFTALSSFPLQIEWYYLYRLQYYISFFFHRRVSKAARIAWVDELPYLRAKVSLAGGLRFSLVTAPGRVNPSTRVNVLIVSRLFDRTLSCPGL